MPAHAPAMPPKPRTAAKSATTAIGGANRLPNLTAERHIELVISNKLGEAGDGTCRDKAVDDVRSACLDTGFCASRSGMTSRLI